MCLWAVGTDRLALPLSQPERLDDARPEKEDEKQRRHGGGAGAKGDVAEDIQDLNVAAELPEVAQHPATPAALNSLMQRPKSGASTPPPPDRGAFRERLSS